MGDIQTSLHSGILKMWGLTALVVAIPIAFLSNQSALLFLLEISRLLLVCYSSFG